jgi:hypothetical protein
MRRLVSCTIVVQHPPIRESVSMEPTKPLRPSYYLLRIICFVWAIFFTFLVRVWPVAFVGWVMLGVLFVLDFFAG